MGKLSDEEKMGVKAGMVVAGILSTFALRYVEPTRGVGKLAMVSHAPSPSSRCCSASRRKS